MVQRPTTPTYQPTFGPNVNSLTVPSVLDPPNPHIEPYQGPQRGRPTLQRQVSVDLTSTILEEMSSSDDDKSSGKSFLTVRSMRRIRRTQSDSSAMDAKTDLDSTTDDQNEVTNSPAKTIIGRSLRITCL